MISSSVAEPADYINGTRFGCDPGRCCSRWYYCSCDPIVCHSGSEYCRFQCYPPPHHHDQLLLATSDTNINIVNATYNAYYDDVTADSSSISCATSLISMSEGLLHKYDWAAFGRHTAVSNSTCGQCLKLRNLESGTEAMVRIVHQLATEGLELNGVIFNKLNATLGDYDHLVLKYNLTSCED
ncbi:Pathogenesis-related protein PR-4B [Linum perenne]